MIGRILGSGQLGKLASFVSPAFFDVMPSKALWAKARQLFSQSRDREAFRHAVAARSADLATAMPQIELIQPDAAVRSSPARPVTADPTARSLQVAELYFRQLFHGETTLLDLRNAAFTPELDPTPVANKATSAGSSTTSGVTSGTPCGTDRLLWRPAPWLAQWSEPFIGHLRAIYRGFYTRDDALFQSGLAALSLEHSADLFRAQFGGDQAHVSFRTADFIGTFHEVFVRCKQAGSSLHPDFLPLGIYLAALYDHLEELAVPVDVALAFARATASAPSDEVMHVESP